MPYASSSLFMTYSYASSTYASTTYLNNNFPTFTYATNTYQFKLTNPVTGTGTSSDLAYWTGSGTIAPLATGTAGYLLQASSTAAGGVAYVSTTSLGFASGGSVTAVTVTPANGVSATVASQGTTPALTFTLGNIIPTSVNGLTFATTTTGFTISTTSQALLIIGSSTLNGANVSGTNSGDVTLVGNSVANGLTISSQALTLALAGTAATGTLDATDWNTFNNKLSTSTAAITYLSIATATSTYMTYGYASSTYIPLASSSSFTNYWSLNGTNIYNNNSGNVGIGTTTPFAPLTVISATDTPYVLAVYGGNGSSTAGSGVVMTTGNGGQTGLVGAPGGNFSFTTGIGGSAVSGESTGANGGDFLVTTAAGGNSTGHQAGGRGGNMTILLGNGGTGYGGGVGGSYSITAGNGNTGTSNGAGGGISLIAGNSPGGASGNITFTPGNNGTNATGSVIISTLAGLGSVVTLGSNGSLTAISSTSLSSLYVSPSHVNNWEYRFNTTPLTQSVTNISVLSTTTVSGASDYGTWDGQHLWVSQFAAHSITELNENGVVMATYTFASNINPQQLAYDGRYIWVASADAYGTLIKFDPTTRASSTTIMNPGGTGSGGIQGILWDGSKLWIGLGSLNDVLRFNTVTGSVEATSTGDTNVNGLAMMDIPENGGVTRYIFAACTNFIAKINGSTMTSSIIGTPAATYRIATDGDFLYGASYLASTTNSTVQKYDARTGTKIVSWNSGTLLNTIAFDGRYIWVSGDDETTTVHDRTSGAVIATLPYSGKSDLIFDGTYMWSVDSTSGTVRKISIGEQMGNVKIAQSMSLMDANNNVGLLLMATSSGSSYIMSSLGVGTTTPSTMFVVIGTSTLATTTISMINGTYLSLGNGSVSTNLAVGYGALATTTGTSNTALGYEALLSNTSGAQNTATGYEALNSNTTGSNNTANGAYSLIDNTIGSSNSGNGQDSLYNNISGNYNTANGAYSLYNNITGSSNTTVGEYALFSNSTSSNNTAIGYRSLFDLAPTLTGSDVAIGYEAGYNATSTNNELFINNYNTGSYVGDQTESLIYGQFNSATSSQYLTINGKLTDYGETVWGNVGIGTSTPGSSLTVASLATTGTLASIFDPSSMTSGSLLSLAANGATTPTGVLTLSANGLTSGNALTISTTNTTQTGSSLSVTTGATGSPTNGLVYFNFNGNRTTAGAAFQITDISTTVATTTQITANSLTSGAALSISATGLTSGTGLGIFTTNASQTGSSLLVTTGSTGQPTNGLVYFNFNGNRTTAGAAFQITDISTTVATTTQITANSLTSGAALSISATGLTSGTGLGIFTTNASQTGSSLLVTTGSTGAVTNGLVYFNFNAAHTGNGFNITDLTQSGNAMSLTANALTSGNGLTISTTNAGQTGSSLLVTTGSTGQPTNGLVYFNFNGIRTAAGTGLQITDKSTGLATALGITASSNLTGFGEVITMLGSRTAGSALLINASSSNASSTTASAGITIELPAVGNGGLRYIRFANAAGAEIGAIVNPATAGTSVALYTTSDKRLKTDIEETHYGLSDLMKIQAVDFNWIAGNASDTGFIAQDLYNIYPNAVLKGDNGTDPYIPGVTNTWSVDYSKLTPLLVKGVQDLNNNFIASTTALLASSSADELGISMLEASSSIDETNINQINNILSQFLNASSSTLTINNINAGVQIITPKIIANGLTVDTISSINDAINFENDTVFFGRPYFNSDTAGFAVIKKGQQSVDVTFDNPYLDDPIVSATITMDNSGNSVDDTAAVEDIFNNNIQYVVTNKSTAGFTIVLNKPAVVDTTFSWIALAVKNAKTFGTPSEDVTQQDESTSTSSQDVSTSSDDSSSNNATSTATTTDDSSVASSTPQDTTPPVITINGDNPVSINVGDTYTDAGAVATDNVDGTDTVTASGTVDTTTAGTYTITYSATDTAGNTATETRIVNVAAVSEGDDATSTATTTSD
jgi:hypothetical protein